MTLAQFLEWEKAQELCHEFDGLRVIAMSGGTAAHAAIQRNLAIAVGAGCAAGRAASMAATSRSRSPAASATRTVS